MTDLSADLQLDHLRHEVLKLQTRYSDLRRILTVATDHADEVCADCLPALISALIDHHDARFGIAP